MHNVHAMTLGTFIVLFLALALAALMVVEWARWRSKRRIRGPGAYPNSRLARRTASVLLLEAVLALVLFFGAGAGRPSRPSRQLALLGAGLALSLGALILALRDLRDVSRDAVRDSEAAAAAAVDRLRKAMLERGLDLDSMKGRRAKPDGAGGRDGET
jgi:hypothetical protein